MEFANVNGIIRLNGQIAITRAIGDKYMRRYGLINEPEIVCHAMQPSYVLLGCDGLFDEIDTQTIDCCVRSCLEERFVHQGYAEQDNIRLCFDLFMKKDQKVPKTKFYEGWDGTMSREKRICCILCYVAYKAGSTDNISALLWVFD